MIKLVLATDINGVIGIGNKLPWRISEEMAHFKKETIGQNVLMGRKTWDSIPSKFKPLVGRHNIVLTSDTLVNGADDICNSVDEAIERYPELTVIGGASVYQQFINRGIVDQVVLSVINQAVSESDLNVTMDLMFMHDFDLVKKVVHDEFKVLDFYLRK